MMKRILFLLSVLSIVVAANAQEAYNEAIRMAKAVADDTSKSLEERKIATFKKDALYYLGSQSYKLTPDSSVTVLDHQALALFQFINLFQGRYLMAAKKDRPAIIEQFKRVSLAHPRFHDPNKEYVLAYITNAGYITQFSLDTDWVAAYNAIRRKMQK
ncbi:MAG: hypothetical protein IKR05_05250 [Prevotella sp.]|nr:hypothetical protein [Prevotella sp.]